jgi:hypothetical protein
MTIEGRLASFCGAPYRKVWDNRGQYRGAYFSCLRATVSISASSPVSTNPMLA